MKAIDPLAPDSAEEILRNEAHGLYFDADKKFMKLLHRRSRGLFFSKIQCFTRKRRYWINFANHLNVEGSVVINEIYYGFISCNVLSCAKGEVVNFCIYLRK
jgi:hypothetical protein